MISSMTGFGSGRSGEGDAEFLVELRSVNHKYVDAKVRMPFELSPLESEFVRRIKESIHRGSIDVSVKRAKTSGPSVSLVVNEDLARSYLSLANGLAEKLGLKPLEDVRQVLCMDGVVTKDAPPLDLEALKVPLFAALDAALAALKAMRLREGEALRNDLLARLDFIRSKVSVIRAQTPRTVEHYRQRLDERIAELTKGIPLDPQRLAQEVALFTDKVDVAEETTRLDTHLKAFDSMLRADTAVGRKMDFLIQEINREVNTIGSKSQSSEIAAIVIDLKAEIERIREQVQNIE